MSDTIDTIIYLSTPKSHLNAQVNLLLDHQFIGEHTLEYYLQQLCFYCEKKLFYYRFQHNFLFYTLLLDCFMFF